MQDPAAYYTGQAPSFASGTSKDALPPPALSVTLQLINVFLLLAAMAVVCCWTSTPSVTKWYLVSVAVADLGHIYAVYRSVGAEYFWNWREWNIYVAGNVWVSLFLHVNRLATVVGLFGGLQGGDGVGAGRGGKKRE